MAKRKKSASPRTRRGTRISTTTRKLGRPDVHKTTPFDADSAQRLIAGTPRTVLQGLAEMLRATGANYLLCIFSFGDLHPEHALRSLELFASDKPASSARGQ